MKSALESYKERYASVNPAGFAAYERGFEAGASELRTSWRCETCIYSYNENGLRCSNINNPVGNGGWNLPEGFGCTQHQEKEEKL